ncbi:MAG: hypothetical protein J6N21_15625 [Butyrivibrio sp.]|nr:hypothetical protein [Butyrivibrio sp.]
MRRTTKILTAFLLALVISGCGEKGNMDLTRVLEPISWTMTRKDVIDKVGTPDENKDSIIVYYDQKLSGYGGEYIYGFDEDDNLRFLKFRFDNESDHASYITEFKGKYGEPDKETHNGSLTFYFWYGTVNGEKASFSYEEGVEMVEIDKD